MGDIRVIEEIKARNEKVFEEIINKYSKLLWKVASGVFSGFNTYEIEECVADVFIYLWEHPEKYEPERGKLSSWLAMIAKSRAIDRFRKLSKEKEISTEDVLAYIDDDVSVEKTEIEGLSEKLTECVEKLPDKEREIIIRKYYREEKNPDIAKAMKIGSKQLENHLYSAKRRLRKLLSE